mgnify:CR=1 FL=1
MSRSCLLNDLNTEREESLNVQFYLDSDKTTQVGEASTIINDTSTGNLQGTYNIITRPSDFIYEGHHLFVTLETKNLPDTELDAQLWMRLSGTNIDIGDPYGEDDVIFPDVRFNINKADGDYLKRWTIRNDRETEGEEVLEIKLYENHSDYIDRTNQIGNTKTITIKDAPPKTYQFNSDPIVNEGESIDIEIMGFDLWISGTYPRNIYYQISGKGIDASDFNDDVGTVVNYDLKGETYLNRETGSTLSENRSYPTTLTFDVKNDERTEGDETLIIEFFSDWQRTQQIGETSILIKDTSKAKVLEKTYSITANNAGTINEGEQLTASITTTNVNDGENIFWNVLGRGISPKDFTRGSLSGSTTISDQQATIEYTPVKDNLTEGSEVFYINLFSDPQRSKSIGNPVQILINDTSSESTISSTLISDTPSYSLVTNSKSIDEGASLRTTVTSQGIEDGTSVYLILSGVGINDNDFTSGTSEEIAQISNNQAIFRHLIKKDFDTEGIETLNIMLFADSEYTQLIGDEAFVSINDTSLNSSLTASSGVNTHESNFDEIQNIDPILTESTTTQSQIVDTSILDRPNPLGMLVYGPKRSNLGFIGMHPIPIRHGMTVGELSTMINEEGWLSDDLKLDNLKVIKMKKIPKSTQFYDWIAPSPNIPDKKTAFIYNGTCLFEGTNISEGRGTDHPFKIIGAPWVDSKDLMEYVQSLKKTKYGNKLIAKEIHFTPKKSNAAINPKYENLVCNGIFIEYLDISIEPIDLVIDLLIYFNLNYTEFLFEESFFDTLYGNSMLREYIETNNSIDMLKLSINNDVIDFKEKRKPYLMYKQKHKQ